MKKNSFLLIAALMIFAFSCKYDEKITESMVGNLTDAKIKHYHRKINQDPANYTNYDNLAQNYIQRARETGEQRYYEEAQKACMESLRIYPDNYVAIVLLAKTEIAEHAFEKALENAKKAVGLKPERSPAYGILGDAYLKLGDKQKAQEAYEKMLVIKPNIDSYSRIANLKFEQSRYEDAVKYMEMAYEWGVKNSGTPDENLAWAQFMIGSYFLDTGNPGKAEKYFKRSLEIFDNYYLAIEHLAELNYLKDRSVLTVKQKTPHTS